MYIASLRSTFAVSFLLATLVFSVGCSSSPTMQTPCGGCQLVFATTNSGQILTFPINPAGGGLGAPTSTPGPTNAAGLLSTGTTSPNGTPGLNLYVSDPQSGAIRVYTLSSIPGSRLSAASFGPYPLSNGNGTPGEMALFGNLLYVATSAGSIAAFTINGDGSLASVAGSPFAAATGLSHLAVAHSRTIEILYASNTGDANGSISAFEINISSGALGPVPGSPFPTVPGGGPAGFYAFEENLYVALQNANAIAGFAIADDGSLTPLSGSPYPAGRGTFSLNGATDFLLATNNLDGTISSYSIDQLSGALTEVAGSPFPGAVTSGDTLYSGGMLYVPDAHSNSIIGFDPNYSTGAVPSLTGSPFRAGASPVALTLGGFPPPPGGN